MVQIEHCLLVRRMVMNVSCTTSEFFIRSLTILLDKSPQIRNGDTGDWIGSFLGHKGAVWSAKVDTLTRTVAATASGDFSAKLWCVTTGHELYEFKHNHVVRSIDFTKVI